MNLFSETLPKAKTKESRKPIGSEITKSNKVLSKPANMNSTMQEIIKNIVCLLIEKYSSTENDSIKPVRPSDKIKRKLILSIDSHQFKKYFIN